MDRIRFVLDSGHDRNRQKHEIPVADRGILWMGGNRKQNYFFILLNVTVDYAV